MAAIETAWQIRGEYCENCNCDVVCPCLFFTKEPMTSIPTQGQGPGERCRLHH
jgi:hypothetical protein